MTPPATLASPKTAKNYMITQLNEVEPTRCPCGWARRGFATPENQVATIHMVDIETDSRVHYHKKMTEIYLVLEGEGFMELDGERVPLKPMTSVFIKPGCRHRAVGKLKIINVPIPAFDPHDEWFD
jgi:mannose-6-phosphate isomerase-like protein (cupin superfamily)